MNGKGPKSGVSMGASNGSGGGGGDATSGAGAVDREAVSELEDMEAEDMTSDDDEEEEVHPDHHDEESSGADEGDEEGDDEDDGDEEADEVEADEGDSSDMDVEECDKKRVEYSDDLTDLEKQFAILREQLYRERITQIEAKLNEVRAGQAPDYLQPLEELQFNMKNRMEVGAVLKELRLQNIKCKYDAEELAAQQNFESEKELLWDSIKADLEEKIHILEEDKNNLDSLWDPSYGMVGSGGSLKSRRRKADPMDPDRRKKPVTVTGPYIAYMLHEAEILDDWTIIKKALAQRHRKTAGGDLVRT